jgi:sugar/nucleoside kinase (ribokinase family)
MLKVLGIGDNVCDKYRHLGKMFPGGQALNIAVHARREGHFAGYMGVFGNDTVGKHVKKVLKDLRIDTSHCREYEGENGFALIDLKNGDRVFVMSNKGGVLKEHPIVLSGEDLSYIETFDWVHTSNNSYIDEELPKLAGASKFLSYDFSTSYTDCIRNEYVCKYVDSAFLSCADMDTGEIKRLLEHMNRWGCPLLTATRGEKGVLTYDGRRYFEHKPEPIKAVDTLGAGDSFAAGFLLSYLENRKNHGIGLAEVIDKAFKKGAAMSARTCMEYGAFGCGTDLV